MRRILSRAVVALSAAVMFSAGVAEAQNGPYVWSNQFGYTGTITRHSSLGDAQSGANALPGSPYAVPQRDLGLFGVSDNPVFSGLTYPPSGFSFLTNWYSSTVYNPVTDEYEYDSPSNTNVGFVQIDDIEGGSVLSTNAYWTDPTRTQFRYMVTGGSTIPVCDFVTGDCPRLWNAGGTGSGDDVTYGNFQSYEFSLLVGGLSQAIWNPATGVFESVSNPNAVSGYFRGIFENDSQDDPSSVGFYRAELSINNISWAAAEYAAGNENIYDGAQGLSYFGSATVVPEPSSLALVAAGIAALGMLARRRRNN